MEFAENTRMLKDSQEHMLQVLNELKIMVQHSSNPPTRVKNNHAEIRDEEKNSNNPQVTEQEKSNKRILEDNAADENNADDFTTVILRRKKKSKCNIKEQPGRNDNSTDEKSSPGCGQSLIAKSE